VLRAVLDANVIVSALIQPEGPSGRIVRAFLRHRAFGLVISPGIMVEVRRCLRRDRTRRHLRVTGEEVAAVLGLLELLGDTVPGTRKVAVVASDPADDGVVAAALEGGAAFVVSGDRHVLEVGEHEGIHFLSPRTFSDLLERLGG